MNAAFWGPLVALMLGTLAIAWRLRRSGVVKLPMQVFTGVESREPITINTDRAIVLWLWMAVVCTSLIVTAYVIYISQNLPPAPCYVCSSRSTSTSGAGGGRPSTTTSICTRWSPTGEVKSECSQGGIILVWYGIVAAVPAALLVCQTFAASRHCWASFLYREARQDTGEKCLCCLHCYAYQGMLPGDAAPPSALRNSEPANRGRHEKDCQPQFSCQPLPLVTAFGSCLLSLLLVNLGVFLSYQLPLEANNNLSEDPANQPTVSSSGLFVVFVGIGIVYVQCCVTLPIAKLVERVYLHNKCQSQQRSCLSLFACLRVSALEVWKCRAAPATGRASQKSVKRSGGVYLRLSRVRRNEGGYLYTAANQRRWVIYGYLYALRPGRRPHLARTYS